MASLRRVFPTLILAAVLSQILTATARLCLAEVIQLHKNHSIGTMWLYDPNPEVLRALVNSGISMSLGAKNEDLHNLASSVEAAKSWIDAHVECYQGINIKYIVAGNEVIPGELAQRVLLAMQNLQSALSGSILGASYPPSSGAFTDNAKGALSGILQFLSDNHAPLLINVYPYFFAALGPVVHDGDLSYWNLLDAMVDAYYTAMEREDFPTVGMKISQSRWPSAGKRNFTTPQVALTYNQNFMKKIKAGTWTPKRPDRHLVTYS
ncbi:hypothetical protein ACJRO7_013875 [Eucalyptus globulus]|uniref:glucan endo-1,3-beta-D-glucosidase n=1 Tax=Eucalyptus globulus TaxID=34317 RepID=A0ABD3L266_EUCGL